MAYHTVDLDAVDVREGLPGEHRYLEDAVDLSNLSLQVVEAAPGEDFAPYHSHGTAEEVFYVLAGTLVVETPEGDHEVEAGEAFLAEPGSPLHPHNPADADGPVRALLVNAPVTDDFQPFDPASDG